MKEISWIKIWAVCKKEYFRWIWNPKWFLNFLLIIPIRECIILPLMQAAQQMEEPINLLEPCIAMVNSGLVVFLLPLSYLVLMMEFPRIDTNMSWYIYRTGRKNWILGEILFQCFSAISFLLFYTLIIIIHVWSFGFWGNGWSLVVTRYDALYTMGDKIDISGIVPINLFYQMSPYKAFLLSYLLMFLSLLLWGVLLNAAALYAKRIYVIAGIVLSLTIGMGLGSSAFWGKWLFLFEHSILWLHFQRYFRDYVFSPYWSVAIFAGLNVICFVWLVIRAGKVSMDILWEENVDD